MQLYRYKPLSVHVIILNPDNDVNMLKYTLKSVRKNYSDCTCSSICEKNIRKNELLEMQNLCKTEAADITITSMINEAMKTGGPEWNLLVLAGNWIRGGLDKKYSLFVEEESDVLFPIADRKMDFIEGTINGIFMNKKFFDTVGEFSDDPSLYMSKATWAGEAIAKGGHFKAIIGSKIC